MSQPIRRLVLPIPDPRCTLQPSTPTETRIKAWQNGVSGTVSEAKPEKQRYWIGVVSREHVKRGEAGGFCQLCHGKAWPMRKMRPGDWLIYYSPREKMRDGEPVQAFTAIGKINDREPYEFDMGGFVPTRRDVTYYPAKEAPIRPMLDEFSFITDRRSWGMVFRRGQIEISRADFILIATAMGVMVDRKIVALDGGGMHASPEGS